MGPNLKAAGKSKTQLVAGSWNVKGLSEVKLFSICMHMRKYRIDIICLQETWALKAEYYSEDGFRIILSGCGEKTRSWAGVGFIIAPWCKHLVKGFLQYSDRMASLKMKVLEGTIGLLSCYAPHNLKPYDDGLHFYSELGKLWERTSVSGPKYLFGDFNARIAFRRCGEEHVLGPHGFGREAVHGVETPNRDLLLEFCAGHEYVVGNMMKRTPDSQKVTYMEPGTSPMDDIRVNKFAMLDLILAPQEFAHAIAAVMSIREAALASDHFLLCCVIQCHIGGRPPHGNVRKDRSALKSPQVRQDFADVFVSACKGEGAQFEREGETGASAQDKWTEIVGAFKKAEHAIPCSVTERRKPWIREATLQLIADRQRARLTADIALERHLHKAVKRAAKADRGAWLNDLVAEGSWRGIKALKFPRRVRHGRLRDEHGELVSSECRAETLATYLEKVQWCVRPSNVVQDAAPLGPELPVRLASFTEAEVKKAIRKMRSGRAGGPDGIPAEYLQTLTCNSTALRILTYFMNCCWERREVPAEWHEAFVAAVYKKGPIDQCANYRPISLLNIGYKAFAAMVHARLVEAGAEDRLSKFQFGFRRKCSTVDALFVLLRRMELAWAQKYGQIVVLALDWAKAFDSIDPSAMIAALHRFGLPKQVLEIIRRIYENRQFQVNECGQTSKQRPQAAGISQGCPLSPFLFVMLMSVLMHDALSKLSPADKDLVEKGCLEDLLYADDTLLLGRSSDSIQRFLAAVAAEGASYGLQLHWGKLQQLNVRCDAELSRPDGTSIQANTEMTYLGSVVSSDGRVLKELVRRIGMAHATFRELARLWKHSSLGRPQKILLFKALAVPKVMYGLQAAWLNKAERRKLDGFQNRCLRVIWGIKPAYVSRVSNESVRTTTQEKPLTSMLEKQQLLLFGRVARQPDEHVMRRATFCPGTLAPVTDNYIRKTGRPRAEWAREVGKLALRAAGSYHQLKKSIASESNWKNVVEEYVQ